jgi:hypothetical protein
MSAAGCVRPKASAAARSDERAWWHLQSSHSLSQYACPIAPPGSPTEGETGQTPKERVIPGVVESAYNHQRQDVGRLGKQLDLPFTTWSGDQAGRLLSEHARIEISASRSARSCTRLDPVAGQEDLERHI